MNDPVPALVDAVRRNPNDLAARGVLVDALLERGRPMDEAHAAWWRFTIGYIEEGGDAAYTAFCHAHD